MPYVAISVPVATVRSSGDPAIPAMARDHPFLEIRHLDPAEVVLRQRVTRGIDVNAEDPRGVQPENLRLHRARERRIPVLLDQHLGNFKAPERFDLPLRRAVPDRVRSPQHVVGTKGRDDLAEQVGARGGIGRDQLPEGGPQLHVDVLEARLLLLHLAKLCRPGDVRGLVGRRDTEEPGVVYEEVDVREIPRRLEQVAWMVIILDGPEGQALVDAQAPYPK